ncbi:MAG: hypothetical protein KC925_00240 [Candidatus Doudnabacteria bacterium]|nr:hypothetical protein [Candidatus Doudnabacteria bacterium]
MEDLSVLLVLPEVVHGSEALRVTVKKLVEAFPDRPLTLFWMSARDAWGDRFPAVLATLGSCAEQVTVQRFKQFGRGAHLFSQAVFLVGDVVRPGEELERPGGVNIYTVRHVLDFVRSGPQLRLVVGAGLHPDVQRELRASLPSVGGSDLDHVLHCQMPAILTELTEPLKRLAARMS